jgi:hypothetical protein
MKPPHQPPPADQLAANESSADFLAEKLASRIAAERENVRRIVPFRWQELPAIDHGSHVGHPLDPDTGLRFELEGGGRVSLDDLYQHKTYAGVLAGVPRDPEDEFESALRQVPRLWGFYQSTPCFLPPLLHCGVYRMRDGAKIESQAWHILPAVTSIALFTSYDLAHSEMCSSALVIWYQDRFAMPDDRTLAQMRGMEWNKHAFEWSW